MLDPGNFDPVAARQGCGPIRIDARKMSSDQFRHFAREGTRLLLDIDHPKRASAVRLPPEAIAEPSVDGLQTSQRIAARGVPSVEPVEDIKLVGWAGRSGDGVDRLHAAAGMGGKNEPIQCEGTRYARSSGYGVGELRQTVVRQPIDAAPKQSRKVVVIVPDPIASRQ